MTTRHPTIGGKGKPASFKPPTSPVNVHIPCPVCEKSFLVTLHDGLNKLTLNCWRCGSTTSALVKSNTRGSFTVYKGSVETWIPDDPPAPIIK